MKAFVGILGGVFFWYFAHELGFYFSDYNCGHTWILPAVHAASLIGCLGVGLSGLLFATTDKVKVLNIGGASIFLIVILWQTLGTLIYNGCER